MTVFRQAVNAVRGILLAAVPGAVSCGSMPSPSYLPAPAIVCASDGAYDDRIAVTWTAVHGASRYALYRSEHFDGPYAKIASPAASSYEDADIAVQKSYCYRVACIDRDDAEGRCGQTDSGYADTVVHIVGLSASDGSSPEGVSLSWTPEGRGEASYRVFRSDSPDGPYAQIAEPPLCSYLDASAEPGRPYFYTIQAVSPLGSESPISNHDSGYRALGAAVLTASKGSLSTGIDLSWTDVAYAKKYQLFRSSSETGPFSLIASPSSPPFADTSADILGGNLSRDFFYKISAVSAYGVEGPASNTDSGYASEGAPSGLYASDGTLYGIRLSWRAVTNASSYRVYRLSGSSFSLLSSTADTTFYDDAVAAGVSYSYKVTALCGAHETPMSAAVSGSAKSPADTVGYRISWNANHQKGVNRSGGGYRIHYSRQADFSIELTQDVPFVSGDHAPTSSVLRFNPDQKGLWYVRLTAYTDIAGGKESPASAVITVKVE